MSKNSNSSPEPQVADQKRSTSASLEEISDQLKGLKDSDNESEIKKDIESLLNHVEEWHCNWNYELARKALDKYNNSPKVTDILGKNKDLNRKFCKKHALSTYKDRSLHGERLDEALKILKKIDTLSECDLRLMSVATADGLASEGRNLVIVALVGTNLHIRIFGANGKRVVDKAEDKLMPGETLTTFKKQLNPLPEESGLSQEQKQQIIRDATSIAGHTLSD